MSEKQWSVRYSKKAQDQYENLKRSGKRPPINDLINFLAFEIEKHGPYRANWPNYSPLKGDHFHCHLKKGKPTYVACWKIIDKINKIIEIYYVGTHENAPY